MPKAVDKHPQHRTVGQSLYNPLRSGVASYEDPLSAIGDDMDAIGGQIGGFFAAVGKIFGLPTPMELIAGVANGIGSLVAGATELITGFGGFFGRLVGGLLDGSQFPIIDPTKVLNLPALLSGFQGVLNGIVRGWRRVPDAVGSVEDVEVIFGQARQVQFGLITLADLANAPDNAPFYVSPNPFEDVSFPRRDLQPVPTPPTETSTMAQNGSSVPSSTTSWSGTVINLINGHRHTIPAPTMSRPRYTIPAGTLALTVLRVTKNRIVNMVRFMAGGDTPTGAIHVGLYKIDPANGNHTRVYDFGDISSEVGTGTLIYECALEMTAEGEVTADAGTLFAVGILPIGAPFAVGGLPRQRSQPDPIIYPQGATEVLTGQTGLPATIAEAALNHDAAYCPWVAVGQTLPTTITPVMLVVDFDAYADNPNWSSPSVKNFRNNSSARWSIVNGKLIPNGPNQIAPINYRLAFLALQPCATDNMFSEYVIGSGWTGATPTVGRCMVSCNAEGTEGVMMQVAQQGSDPATITIETITDMVSGGTVKATSTGVVHALPNDVFRIEAVFDEDDGVTTFTCYRNGDPIPGAVWEDTGHVAHTGKAWRRCAYGATAASFSNTTYRAASADEWRAGDLAA